MEVVLYGDILFLINFSMDFLTLFVTSKILHLKTNILPLLFASAIGAIYAIASVMLEGAAIISLMINVAVSFLMCYIAFSVKILRCTALFYTIGLVLGGALTASFTVINRIRGSRSIFVNGSTVVLSGNIPLGWMAVITALTSAAAILSGRFAKARKYAPEVTVKVEDQNKTSYIRGLTDSGNFLKDPFEGTPVIVAKREVLMKILPEDLEEYFLSNCTANTEQISSELLKKIRIIPASGASGAVSLLMGFIPEKVEINGAYKKVCIAADSSGRSNPLFGGFDAIVPTALL